MGIESKPEEIKFQIGPYQILQCIGQGGMGEVFLAYDPLCDSKIALKRIRPDLHSSTKSKEQFLKEAQLTSRLTHPAIIPIYSIANDGESLYYTMPFIEGQTLKQIFEKARQQ